MSDWNPPEALCQLIAFFDEAPGLGRRAIALTFARKESLLLAERAEAQGEEPALGVSSRALRGPALTELPLAAARPFGRFLRHENWRLFSAPELGSCALPPSAGFPNGASAAHAMIRSSRSKPLAYGLDRGAEDAVFKAQAAQFARSMLGLEVFSLLSFGFGSVALPGDSAPIGGVSAAAAYDALLKIAAFREAQELLGALAPGASARPARPSL